MTAETGLIARDLERFYGHWKVVDKVTVEVRRGEVVGLLGPNGAGKTTTFYLIVGLLRSDGGKITVDGRDITRVPMHQRARLGIGYLQQEPSVFRRLTVRENILAILETLPLTGGECAKRLDELRAFNPTLYIQDECFVAGTPIRMADGTDRPIEHVRAGDRVLAYDEARSTFVGN